MANLTCYDIIKKPVVSEKSMNQMVNKKYTFIVHKDATKNQIKDAVEKAGGILIITADHGNADDMYEHAKDGSVLKDKSGNIKVKTSHSLNPVPCIIYDPEYKGEYSQVLNSGLGISSIASTCIELLGFNPPSDYDKSIINI